MLSAEASYGGEGALRRAGGRWVDLEVLERGDRGERGNLAAVAEPEDHKAEENEEHILALPSRPSTSLGPLPGLTLAGEKRDKLS